MISSKVSYSPMGIGVINVILALIQFKYSGIKSVMWFWLNCI